MTLTSCPVRLRETLKSVMSEHRGPCANNTHHWDILNDTLFSSRTNMEPICAYKTNIKQVSANYHGPSYYTLALA